MKDPDPKAFGTLSIMRESLQLGQALLHFGSYSLPNSIGRRLLPGSGLRAASPWDWSLAGELLMALLEQLGPVYGKAVQTILSRFPQSWHPVISKAAIDRVYGDWPEAPRAEIEVLMDRELPQWRTELHLETTPLGGASIAQVYGATDRQGKSWVVKVVKPKARQRLLETLAAIEQWMLILKPFALSRSQKRMLREIAELCNSMRNEIRLDREAKTILKLRQKLARRKTSVMCIPQVHPELTSENVLVVERFHGVPLAKVLDQSHKLAPAQKRKLAERTLYDMLVQVFELGLFHGDPHAGNLILMEDGQIGLFDWGLAGELGESDRRVISELLKAVLAKDLDRLCQALVMMAEGQGTQIAAYQVQKEMRTLSRKVADAHKKSKNLPLQDILEQCLTSADRLSIPIPSGLLMMAKSLLTIEGLSRGIDPEVSLAKVASPFLLKAARLGPSDILQIGRAWIWPKKAALTKQGRRGVKSLT